jgi:hypothetical protein
VPETPSRNAAKGFIKWIMTRLLQRHNVIL